MELKELYRSKDLSGVFLLIGKEKLLMEDVLKYSVDKWTENITRNLNLDYIEGEKALGKDILDKIETLPFMGEKRILVVKDFGSFIESRNLEDAFFESLFLAPKTSLIFLLESETPIKKTTKFYKKCKKLNRVVECNTLKHNEIVSFIDKYCKRREVEISRSDIEFFIHRSNYENRNTESNLYEIKNELDKLIALSKGQISREKISASMEEVSTDNIFDLLESLSKSNVKNALEIKKDLLSKEEPIQKIIFMINRQVRLLLSYKLLDSQGFSMDEIQNKLGIKSYEAKKIKGQNHSISLGLLKKYYKFLIEADQSLKRSLMEEDMVMDLLILKMGQKKTENF